MLGRGPSERIEDCDIQEIIDYFNNLYIEIGLGSKLGYIRLLHELFLKPAETKELLEKVEKGQYYVRGKVGSRSRRWYVAIRERDNNQDLGITKEQIEALKKFLDYLEQDDIKEIILNEEKARRKLGLIAIPILIIIIYFTTRSSIFWSTFMCGGLSIFYIIMVIGMIKDKEFSKKKDLKKF